MNHTEHLQLESQPAQQPDAPTLVYLPGVHGDLTLVQSFRAAVRGHVHWAGITYPRTLTWSVPNYAEEIRTTLLKAGVRKCWILGESYGSQPAWELVAHPNGLEPEGLILAGGFVRYPIPSTVHVARTFLGAISQGQFQQGLRIYKAYAAFRHRKAPETHAAIDSFIARRTELDRLAMLHRFDLIQAYDARPVARRLQLPVYQLAGLWDPIVPWGPVTTWLLANCPGYRGRRVLPAADHNVLSTTPHEAANTVLRWISEPC